MTKDCLEIQTCEANIYTVTKGTYGTDPKSICNDVTEQCVADARDPRQGFCEKIAIPQDAKFCTIISNAYMSDFEAQWINYWTECPTIILNSWRGLSIERHGYEYRVIANSVSGKNTVQFDTWNARWSVNGAHVRSPTSYIRGQGRLEDQTGRHLYFTKDTPSFEDLKAAIKAEYEDREIFVERDDEQLFSFHIFRTSSYEILFIPDYELALMIDQTHDIVKLAIPSGSLDFTGGVCMAADKNGMFKPDLEKAASTSEFFEAWAAEADIVETQILSTKDECGEEKQIEVPVVPEDPCESYAFTNADYIGEAKVLYGAHCEFLINRKGPFAKCFQLVNPFPYYQACISDLGRSKNFDHREFFGQAYSEECAFRNYHVDQWRDILNAEMVLDFLNQMEEFTTPEVTTPTTPVTNPNDPDTGNNDPVIVVDPIVEDFKRANVMVFLVESIYEQMKVFIQMFIDMELPGTFPDRTEQDKTRLVILDVDFEPFRRELQNMLDGLLDTEPTDDVRGIYFSVFYQFFAFFDSIKFYNFKYTTIFEAGFDAAWNVDENKLDLPTLVTCFFEPDKYITDNRPDNIFVDMEEYIKTQVIDLNKDFCDVMDEVDGISRARYDMNYFDLWLQGENSIGKLYVYGDDMPYGDRNDINNVDKDKALAFFHYIDVFMQIKSNQAKFCTVYIANEADNLAAFTAGSIDIRSFLVQNAGEEDLMKEVIEWLAAGRFVEADYEAKINAINSQINDAVADMTDPDMCIVMNEYILQILVELDEQFDIFYFIEVLRHEGAIETTPREEVVIQRIIDMVITALFYRDTSTCDIMTVRYGESWRVRVEAKFRAIIEFYRDFNWENDNNPNNEARSIIIINRVIMLWLGDLSQSVDWSGNQCVSDCTEPEIWPDTPSPRTPKTGKTKKKSSKKSKSPKSRTGKGKSKKSKSKKGKSKSGKWKSGKWKSGKGKSGKSGKSKTPKSPKRKGKARTWSGSRARSGSYSGSSSGSGSRKRRAIEEIELVEEPTIERHRRSSSRSGSGSGSRRGKKGKKRGSYPKTKSPKTKRPKTKSPKYKTPTPVVASPEPNWNTPRCGVVGVWCRIRINSNDDSIREQGYFTINQFEEQLYFFNSRQPDIDPEETLIEVENGNFVFSYGTTNPRDNKIGTLSADKSSITFTDGEFPDGETWYRKGSEQCERRRTMGSNDSGHINIPNIRERDCGKEFKYKWTTVDLAFYRLRRWMVNGYDNRWATLRSEMSILWNLYKANPDEFSFCRDFDITIRNIFSAPTVRFVYREPLERTFVYFGIPWREFIKKFYEDTVSHTLEIGQSYGDIVQEDFKAFYMNRKDFNERVTETLAALGVYRPRQVNVNTFFDLKIKLLQKRFNLGLPFCEVMDSSYRELYLLTTEKVDRFTDSIENFQNTLRYYTEEFLVDVFGRDNDICAVRDDALNGYGLTADEFNGVMKDGLDLAIAAFNDDNDQRIALSTKMFKELEFSSLFTDGDDGDKVDVDIKSLVLAALANIGLGTNNFDFIQVDTEDRDAFNDQFYTDFVATLTSMSDIFAANDADLCTNLKTTFAGFVDSTSVYPLGFCDEDWDKEICLRFNVLIEGYNSIKLKYNLFQDEAVADIAARFDAKIRIQDSLSEKQKQLMLAREMKTAVVKHFNEMRVRVEPVQIIKESDDKDTILDSFRSFKTDLTTLKDELAANTNIDQTRDGFVLCDTLLTEVDGFITGADARRRKRRSFDDLSLTNEADRATLRQHIPLFGEPACGENAVFSDHAHHGKWRMDESKFFKTDFEGVSTVLEYGPGDYNKALNIWNAETVPAIKYFAGIRFPGCSCPHGQMYFNGVCAEVITGCKFNHDGKDILMRIGEKYHYDCHTEFYCKEDGTHIQRDIHCPDEFCNFDLRTGNTYCEYLGFNPCLENGYKMIALPIFTTGSHSGTVSFRAINNNYADHDAFSFSMLYLGRDEADAVVVKETANDEISEWYADYNTDDIINLMMAAEGLFGNSMARRQVLYLQIDAAVLVKFNDQIVTILNRLQFNGVNIMLGEIGEIPILFKSMIPSEQSFALDFNSADNLAAVADKFCSVNECDFNNGGCSHECQSNMFQRAVCLCPTGYVLDGRTCLPTAVTCEITSNMEREYDQWRRDLEEWENM